jgi:hypothetical protein
MARPRQFNQDVTYVILVYATLMHLLDFYISFECLLKIFRIPCARISVLPSGTGFSWREGIFARRLYRGAYPRRIRQRGATPTQHGIHSTPQ